ncbi:MAG TPA: hypothetical protein VNR65_01295, partial [Geobacterales bacterium]|nr:hypothetical protein [Geobacterales bacterium]
MTARYIGPSLWVVFASVLGLISYLLLSACDFGRPLFGFRYCQSQVSFPHTASRYEQERERSLKRHLHEAELRTAQLPVCIQKPQPE